MHLTQQRRNQGINIECGLLYTGAQRLWSAQACLSFGTPRPASAGGSTRAGRIPALRHGVPAPLWLAFRWSVALRFPFFCPFHFSA